MAIRNRIDGKLLFLLVLIAGLLASPPAAGAEKKKQETLQEREAREAAAEDEAEAKLDPDTLNRRYEGRLVLLLQPNFERPDIVGTLTTPQKTFVLKLESAAVLDKIKPYNGKTLTLLGKVRNQGQYLIVEGILERGAPPIENPKRGGV